MGWKAVKGALLSSPSQGPWVDLGPHALLTTASAPCSGAQLPFCGGGCSDGMLLFWPLWAAQLGFSRESCKESQASPPCVASHVGCPQMLNMNLASKYVFCGFLNCERTLICYSPCLPMHPLVDSCMFPDQGSNPQPFIGMTLAN